MKIRRHGRCCCMFSCLAASAGLALVFLGVFLALLGMLQSSAGHHALRVSGCVLAGSGVGLLLSAGAALLWPGGRGEMHSCCMQHGNRRGTQVGAADCDSSRGSSASSGDSFYEPPPELRVIPPTPFVVQTNLPPPRPETAPEFVAR